MPDKKKVSNTQKEQTARVLRLVYEQACRSLTEKSETLAAAKLQEIQRTNPTYSKMIEAYKKVQEIDEVRNAALQEFQAASKDFYETMGNGFPHSYNNNTKSMEQFIVKDLAYQLRHILKEKLGDLKNNTEIQILLVDTDESLTEILRKFQEAVNKLGE